MVVNGTSYSISLWLFTIYDLRFANNAQRSCGNLAEQKATDAAHVRCWMYDGGAWQRLCTKYDVRCTICKFVRAARNLAEQVRAGCRETVRERSYKATFESMKSPVSTHRKLGTGKGKYKGLKIFPSGHKVPPPCTSGRRAKATTPATNNWRNFQPACRG